MNVRAVSNADAYRRFQQAAEIPMLVLALLFVPAYLLSRHPAPTPGQQSALEAATWFIWAVFVVEYVILFVLADDKRLMVRTHILDLVIIVLPFLRPLRALRILRVFAAAGRAGVAWRRVATRSGFRPLLAGALLLVGAGDRMIMRRRSLLGDANAGQNGKVGRRVAVARSQADGPSAREAVQVNMTVPNGSGDLGSLRTTLGARLIAVLGSGSHVKARCATSHKVAMRPCALALIKSPYARRSGFLRGASRA